MDFYFDAQIPKNVIAGLNLIESSEDNDRRCSILSTAIEFGDNIEDVDLFQKLAEVSGILVTHDLKMTTRAKEFALLKELGLTAFIISLPHGTDYSTQAQAIINRWYEVKKIFRKHKHEMPFICRITTGGHNFF